MGIVGDVSQITKNTGKEVNNSSINNSKKNKSQSMADENMFLSLLVAEMQYQDPLEPTSNTEYVSELATFTQVSSLQEMNATIQNMGSQSLVGQYVKIINEDGEEFAGLVDYTTVKDGETMVSIDDQLYKASDVKEVINAKYYEANENASAFSEIVKKLPDEYGLTISDKDEIEKALGLYNAFDNYTMQFVDQSDVDKITKLVNRLNSLLNPADKDTVSADDASGAAEETESENTEETVDEAAQTETSEENANDTADSEETTG
ncbi:MAG: hypothetical protein IIZ61_03300 [Lachnospiraceae bacterium]|nr:hypothetical protein [Lachnospiraceae bacterium]